MIVDDTNSGLPGLDEQARVINSLEEACIP